MKRIFYALLGVPVGSIAGAFVLGSIDRALTYTGGRHMSAAGLVGGLVGAVVGAVLGGVAGQRFGQWLDARTARALPADPAHPLAIQAARRTVRVKRWTVAGAVIGLVSQVAFILLDWPAIPPLIAVWVGALLGYVWGAYRERVRRRPDFA